MNQPQIEKIDAIARFVVSSEGQKHSQIWSKQHKTLYAIYQILTDGKWHSSEEIARKTGKSVSHVKQIMPNCKEAWDLAAMPNKGYMMLNKNQSIVV